MLLPDHALVNDQVGIDLIRAQGMRVRIYYLTRVWYHQSHPHPVWGDNEANVDQVMTAHCIARVMHVGQTHVLVQPDNHPRPVAMHRRSIQRVARVLLVRGVS